MRCLSWRVGIKYFDYGYDMREVFLILGLGV